MVTTLAAVVGAAPSTAVVGAWEEGVLILQTWPIIALTTAPYARSALKEVILLFSAITGLIKPTVTGVTTGRAGS